METIEIAEALRDLQESMQQVKAMLKILLKERASDKLDLLEEEVRKAGVLITKEVERRLSVSTTWALKMMRRLSTINPNFMFTAADPGRKVPCRIIFTEHGNWTNLEKIAEMLAQEGELPIGKLMRVFKLAAYKEGILLAQAFIDVHPEAHIDESLIPTDKRLKLEDAVKLRYRKELTKQ